MPLNCMYSPQRVLGTWRHIPMVDGTPGNLCELTCPACGISTVIDIRVAAIDDKGLINAPISCFSPKCNWGVPSVRLRGWKGPAIVSEPETVAEGSPKH